MYLTKKVPLSAALVFVVMISCKKQQGSDIYGVYTETELVAGRSQLKFIRNNRFVRMKSGSNFSDTFHESFSGDKIFLTPAWTNQYTAQAFDFTRIDDRSFRIENLYTGIPSATKSYMTYKK